MGFPVILLPKTFDVNSLLAFGQPQAPANNFIMGGDPWLNAMPPGSDAPDFTWLRYQCQGSSMVCQGTNDEDLLGNPINWAITDTSRCTDKNDKWPGSITMLNCNAIGRNRPLPVGDETQTQNGTGVTPAKVLPYAGAALVVLVVVGIIWAVNKKAK